ncbi:MAG: hypothetical protein FWG14_02290 [Peptococcaceae bacterium]|nr:hypothetical protein [Peptococcaceae bacterium]
MTKEDLNEDELFEARNQLYEAVNEGDAAKARGGDAGATIAARRLVRRGRLDVLALGSRKREDFNLRGTG